MNRRRIAAGRIRCPVDVRTKLSTHDLAGAHEPRPDGNWAHALPASDVLGPLPAQRRSHDLREPSWQMCGDDPMDGEGQFVVFESCVDGLAAVRLVVGICLATVTGVAHTSPTLGSKHVPGEGSDVGFGAFWIETVHGSRHPNECHLREILGDFACSM